MTGAPRAGLVAVDFDRESPSSWRDVARSRLAVDGPRDEQVPAGACDADVEQTPFLLRVGLRPAGPEGQFTVDRPGEEHCVELEALRPVVRKQVHAAGVFSGGEPVRQLGEERRRVVVRARSLEFHRERAQPREVGLPRDLLVGIRRIRRRSGDSARSWPDAQRSAVSSPAKPSKSGDTSSPSVRRSRPELIAPRFCRGSSAGPRRSDRASARPSNGQPRKVPTLGNPLHERAIVSPA